MVKVLKKAFDIVEYVAKSREGQSRVSQISKDLKINATTCVRTLEMLASYDYITKLPKKDGYALGPRFYLLSAKTPGIRQVVENARMPIKKLSEKIHESVVFASFHNDKRLALISQDPPEFVKVRVMNDGDENHNSNPLNNTTGRVLLSMLSQDELEAIISDELISESIWADISSVEDTTRIINEVRNKGFADHFEEDGLGALAVPLNLGAFGLFSVGIYMPAYRYEKIKKEKVLNELRNCAGLIRKSCIGKN